MPMKIRDNRTVNYNLAPQLIVPTQELIGRANQLRQDTLPNPAASAVAVPGPIGAPAPTVVLPPASSPEPLPGLSPPPFNQPVVPQAMPGPPPGGGPIALPRP